MTNHGVSAGVGVRVALAAVMTVMSVGLLEVAVRVVGHTDPDGNFHMGQRQGFPLHLPIGQLEAAVRQYRQSAQALFTEDATLGWKPKAGAQNDLYAYDRDALRSRTPEEASADPDRRALRVAIFGDSFAHGSEVSFDDSWGARVEHALNRPGRPVDVLNFGVPGYGMDQALLRWEHEGRAFAPAVVVFGLQVENAGRNLNLLRVLYDSADLPFAKPRFVEDDGRLELINVPVPPPEEVVRIVGRLDEWPLVHHEHYYRPDRYRDRPWRYSRLAGLIESSLAGSTRGQIEGELPGDQRRLALRIIDRFAESVEAAGARFVVVHLPRRVDLEAARSDGRLPNSSFLDAVQEQAPVVRVDTALLERGGQGDLGPLFSPGGHYSSDGYAVLAAAVAERLESELAPAASRTGRTRSGTH